MLNPFKKKAVVKATYENPLSSVRSTSYKLDDESLLEYLSNELDRHGELIITHIENDTIYLTSSKTQAFNGVENELEDIKNLIKEHIINKSVALNGIL